ncbi:hypothetical protein QL285_080179 [Trifolium repens]|nr:hypothetical protein QL285_080179 [Trifolium repens]
MANYRIDTAFRSFRHNECYFITNGRCLVLDYFKKSIVNGPRHIENVFPILRNTPFRRRIDCTFNGDENEIFIFSRNLCAKIRYTAEGRLLNVPISITRMFPRLRGTSFENGIDAAFKYRGNDVFLFKKDRCIRLNYITGITVESEKPIRESFPCLVGTIFETGIDAAFASHDTGEAYIFKGRYFVRINAVQRGSEAIGDFIVGRRIRFIADVWTDMI